MRRIYYVALILILALSALIGCSDEEQITTTINDFITAYNERDTRKCLALWVMGESSVQRELDGDYSSSLQHYFDAYPSTPTISLSQLTDISFTGGDYAIVLIDFYSVEYDTNVFYQSLEIAHDIKASAMADDTYSAQFNMVETEPGFLGFYSTWKIDYIKDIPGYQ